jgi:hypothetical protein
VLIVRLLSATRQKRTGTRTRRRRRRKEGGEEKDDLQ